MALGEQIGDKTVAKLTTITIPAAEAAGEKLVQTAEGAGSQLLAQAIDGLSFKTLPQFQETVTVLLEKLGAILEENLNRLDGATITVSIKLASPPKG